MEEKIKKLAGSRRAAGGDDANARYVARNAEALARFNFKQGDIFLVTYPKCGTHWMKYIIWGIVHQGQTPPDLNQMNHGNCFPNLELTGTKDLETRESPRTFRTHLPSDLVPYSSQTKYIHVTRNPLDCCLSHYNFVKSTTPEVYGSVTLDQFFDDFMDGKLFFGDYFEHFLGWYEHKDDDNYLHITYEEMIKDHRGSILKVAEFLGEDYYREILKDEELLKKIEYHSSFSFMKSLPKFRKPKHRSIQEMMEIRKNFSSSDDEMFRNVELINKGQVGGFKSEFSEEQQQKMRKKMEEKFQNTDLLRQGDRDV